MNSQQNASRTPRFWNGLKLILALILIGFVLSKVNIRDLLALKDRIQAGWLAAVFVLFVLLTLLKSLQYYYLIGRRVGYPQVLNIVVVQNAMSNFVAAGAGVVSYLALFRVEQGVRLSKAALAFILVKIADLVMVGGFLLVAAWTVWPQIEILHSAVALILGLIGLALIGFIVAVFFRERFITLITSLSARFHLEKISVVTKGLNAMRSAAEQGPAFIFRTIGIGTMFSLIYMLVTMTWLYAGLRAFSFQIDVMPVVFVNSLIQLVSYLPVQILGGLGVNESTSMYLYGFFNVQQTELAAVLIANRLLFYLTNLFVLLYLPMHALTLNRSIKKE